VNVVVFSLWTHLFSTFTIKCDASSRLVTLASLMFTWLRTHGCRWVSCESCYLL